MRTLEDRFGHGNLKDHGEECWVCGGTGCEDRDDPESDPCDECDGEGRCGWGSFYVEDRSDCALCKREEVGVSGRLLRCGLTGMELYICLPCYVAHHRDECGCMRWAAAEAAMDGRSER